MRAVVQSESCQVDGDHLLGLHTTADLAIVNLIPPFAINPISDLVRANEFDPFFDSAFDYFPYVQFRSHVSKGFGDYLTVESGLDLRRVRHDSDESRFNRDYERVYLTPSFENVFLAGLSVDLTGEYWASDGGEDVITYGADLSYEVNDRIRASLGTYYALYKHDLTSTRERERVRTYYLGVEWRRGVVRLKLDYEFEDDELDNYHQLGARLIWTF